MFLTILSDLVPARYGYRIERIFSHDKTAYTQGLLFHNGFFYESTGQEGRSTLRKVDPETGVVIRRLNLEAKFFGEGIALLGDRIYQLTWKHKVGFVYDIENFTELGKFYYNTEGWGLTTVDDRLVMSDGSNKLYVVDPNGFITVRIIEVYDNKSMVMYLNELEYVNGEIWANVFMSDLIARIDPATGKVTGYIDLKGILPDSDKMNEGDDVLNGIAWDRESGRIWVTGKNWPKLFQIRVTGQ
ncbi:MAG: glutaminyl-peptide cyclotransferase [Bacteroidetes bacterium]|nr:glutaminyl-peptide cyclotransferase [Bacteroidota bacterium]